MEYRSYTKKIWTYTKKLCYAASLASVLLCSWNTPLKKKSLQAIMKENIVPHMEKTHEISYISDDICYIISIDQEEIRDDALWWEVIWNQYLRDPTNKTLLQLKKRSADDILSVMQQLGLSPGCRKYKDLETWIWLIQSVPYHLDDIEHPVTCDTLLYGKPFSWWLVEWWNCYWHVLYAWMWATILWFDNVEALHIYPPKNHIHHKKRSYPWHHMMLWVCLNNNYSPWEMTKAWNDIWMIHADWYWWEREALEWLVAYGE